MTAEVDDVVLAPGVSLPLDARVRVRYRHEGADARIELAPDRHGTAIVRFKGPVRAVSRGQVAVFYECASQSGSQPGSHGDRVLGGGRLCYSHAS
jgi:tRNA U34 2-thiouridine synthase MnmA/TrmU